MEFKHGASWLRVSTRQPCPICHKTHWCMLASTGHTVLCMRVPSDKPTPEGKGLGGWFHQLGADPSERRFESALATSFAGGSSQQLAEPGVRHRVNEFLLQHQPLQSDHRRHLVEVRRLSPVAIAERGYGTWDFPDRRQRANLASSAYNLFGAVVYDVPGFCVRKQHDKEYLTLTGGRGLLIPIRGVDGRIAGYTIKGEGLAPKYYPLSRNKYGGASLGVPVHVARPRGAVVNGSVYLTEGPLKADLACEYLGQIVVAVPGVSSVKNLVPTLLELKKRGELDELIVALDEDIGNAHVDEAKRKIAEEVARAGIPVTMAGWSKLHKGLDDLLQAGGTPQLTPYRVAGNGKRVFEEVPSEPRATISPMSLSDVRKLQSERTREFLLRRRAPGEQDEVLLIRTQPGVGKSTLITELANLVFKKQRRRAGLFVSRHNLAMQAGRELWNVIHGRTHTDEDHPQPPCSYAHLQQEFVSRGIPAQAACEHCPLLKSCQTNTRAEQGPYYFGQFLKSAPATVYQAAHLLTPSLWQASIDYAILDDLDLHALRLEETRLSASQVGHALRWAEEHPDSPYARALPLLRVLHELLQKVPYGKAFHWDGKALFQHLEKNTTRPLGELLDEAAQAEEPDAFGQRQIDAPLVTPKRFLKAIVGVLRFEFEAYKSGQEWNRRLRVERKDASKEHYLLLTLRRDLPLDALKGKPIVILDASTTRGEIQRLFPDRKIIEIDPSVAMSRAVTIHQNPTLGYGKRQLSETKNRDRAFRQIAAVIARHVGEKTGLITHKSFERIIKSRFPQLKTTHFYGQRGSNELADCQALLVLGTPNPNPADLERQAEALYWDGPLINPQTVLESRAFETRKARTLKTAVRNYVDPRLQELLNSKREQELIQSIFRARPLSIAEVVRAKQMDLYENPTTSTTRESADIYLWSNIALPGICVALIEAELLAEAQSQQLEAAARNLWRSGRRITEQKLAAATRVQRAHIRHWRLAPNARWTEAAHPATKAPPW